VPILSPRSLPAFPGTQTAVRQTPLTATDTIGFYGTDTIALNEHWSVPGGAL